MSFDSLQFCTVEATQIAKEQIISQCHSLTTKIPLTILFFTFIIFFLIFGFSFVKHDRNKILKILFWTFAFTAIVYAVLYFMPITVTNEIYSWFNQRNINNIYKLKNIQ